MSSGDFYQAGVAAWFSTQILAEKNASTSWELEAGETFEMVACHTDNPVDDILVETSRNRRFFINVKIKVDNEKSEKSDLAGFADQAVRQFIQNEQLRESNGRILLITSSKSSPKIKETLRSLFMAVRNNRGQPLSKIAKNAEEKSVLENFINHAKTFWKRSTNRTPNENQLRQLLESIWIQILDIDKGESDEGTAQIILNSLLTKGNKSGENAWNLLIKHCWELFKRSETTDRRRLQSELGRLGLRLKAAPSFQEDIETLKKLSRKSLTRLRKYSVIMVGEKEIKISRPVKNALIAAAEEKSIVVTGDAGAGKSGVLHDLVDDLMTAGRDVVFLSVDRIKAISESSFREDEKLEHNLDEILDGWIGDEPAFLVIDALDASRDPDKAGFLNNLIEDIILLKNRWRVVVSIRRFDLRNNSVLNGLFSGQPVAEYALPEFPNLRHINVFTLQAEEMMQVFSQHWDFAELYNNGGFSLQKLLFLPFNLKLIGELFGDNVKFEELSPIQAQIELLERYWQKRVRDSVYDADANELALAKIVKLMVERREMQLSRLEILEVVPEKTLGEILHQDILIEGRSSNGRIDTSVIDFPHHVLFDYAVARLVLRGTQNTLYEKLENDRELVLAIRPSLLYHFQYELLKGEQHFWEQLFKTYQSDKIPTIGKLVGTSIAVNSAKSVDFFEPLFRKLAGIDAEDKKPGKKVLSHISHELRYRSSLPSDNPILNHIQLWLDFLEKLSGQLTPETVNDVRYIFWNFIDRMINLSSEQFLTLGVVARRLLDFALTLPYQDFFLVTNAITFVCRTFATSPDESVKSLRPILSDSRVRQYGHRELRFFADEIESLSIIRPDFVGEIYRAAFINVDLSEDTTSISFSRIMNLTSTRRQDFMHMRLELRTRFRSFLKQSPLEATRALIEIFDSYGEEEFSRRLEERRIWFAIDGSEAAEKKDSRQVETFTFKGIEARIKSDYSRRWDDGANYRDEEILNLLGTFRNYLQTLCEDESETFAEILDLLVRNNKMAVFWRKIIFLGTSFPDRVGREIRSLAWTRAVLANEDTYELIAKYLENNFSLFTDQERKLTEKAILSIPRSPDSSEKENLIYVRNYLLSYLDENFVTSAQALKIIRRLKQKYEERRQSAEHYNYELAAESGAVEFEESVEPENKETPFERNLLNPIKSFAEIERRSNPVLDEIKRFLPIARNLYAIINNPEDDGVSQKEIDRGWHYLSKLCSVAVEMEDLSGNADIFGFLKEVMLAASHHPFPSSDKDESLKTDEYPWTGFPFTRGNAGRGLARIARFGAGAGEEVLERVEHLALRDPVQAVRYHTAVVINSLYETAPDLMWRILNGICQKESSFRVLRGVTESPLRRLAALYPEKIFELNKTVFQRVGRDENAGNIRKNCIHIFMHLAFLFGHKESWQILDEYISQPSQYKDEIWQMVTTASNSITAGIDEPRDTEKGLIRRASFKTLEKVCRAAHNAFQTLYDSLSEKDFNLWTEQEKDDYKNLHRIIEHIALKIYFASGADKHHHSTSYRDELKIPQTKEERTLFWNESKTVLDALAEVGFADTTHRLVETLSFMLPYAPYEAFIIFGKAIGNGKRDLYQYESMAISDIVALVKKVFGEFSFLLKNHRECREIIIEVLDTFIDAGWEPALKLTYQLNDIHR